MGSRPHQNARRTWLPAERELPAEQWERHHALVVSVVLALGGALSVYAAVRGRSLPHVLGHVAPLGAVVLVARLSALPRVVRQTAAALGLMVASSLAVHLSEGAPEAHFAFFALLPLAALYASRAPFLLAVAYVGMHHLVLGSLAPQAVFGRTGPVLGLATLHAGFVLAESLACLAAWRLFEDRRELVEQLVLQRTEQLREQHDAMQHLALHDPLTGLANRALMADRLEQALVGRDVRQHAVLLLDLDDFKSINDVHGHAVGDALLVEVARRLAGCLRLTDTAARLGGDEFVLLVEDVDGVAHVLALTRRVLAALNEPLAVGDRTFQVSTSIGIALTDRPEVRDGTEVLRDADIAMYSAKSTGAVYRLFEPGMRTEVVARTELVRDLRRAIAHDQLRVVYQPQIDLRTGRMTGVEALVRWQHPVRGLLCPDEFVPVAEATGLIVGIDDWVLAQACRQLRAWDESGLPRLDLAVNVSAGRLVTGDLAALVRTTVDEAGVDAHRLEIEITETVAVARECDATDAVRALRDVGVRVALDDFGMGHSALSRLRAFPLDRLKIDRSFVALLGHGDARSSIAGAMVALAGSLGLGVVAEGVQEQQHVVALRALGCFTAQGYLFSPPVPPEAIEQLALRVFSVQPDRTGPPALTGA